MQDNQYWRETGPPSTHEKVNEVLTNGVMLDSPIFAYLQFVTMLIE